MAVGWEVHTHLGQRQDPKVEVGVGREDHQLRRLLAARLADQLDPLAEQPDEAQLGGLGGKVERLLLNTK